MALTAEEQRRIGDHLTWLFFARRDLFTVDTQAAVRAPLATVTADQETTLRALLAELDTLYSAWTTKTAPGVKKVDEIEFFGGAVAEVRALYEDIVLRAGAILNLVDGSLGGYGAVTESPRPTL